MKFCSVTSEFKRLSIQMHLSNFSLLPSSDNIKINGTDICLCKKITSIYIKMEVNESNSRV